MRKYALKIALVTLVSSVALFVALISFLSFGDSNSTFFLTIGNALITFSLFFLLVTPLIGFVFSLYISGKRKWIYLLSHIICMATISAFSFISIMFRYFVPFAP
ncbi:hypothetical protein [Halalkalibacter krulwichiae]|uniref:Uncharacterized protein n=1 Tax=Halalkalibacter krulwichiae TaxID=199441 RepID=A0A1X9MJS5_9BACI|nr:hypothetical protein [Halalkalibacter krulwichiae]ARK30852.1 hypothetical protein BkAM31D_13940 [Halalkalibacter krulwichiae]